MTETHDALEKLPLSELLASVDSPAGRERFTCYLEAGPFPHFYPHPERRGILERVDADGTRTPGRFVGREFKPSNPREM
ncbi:MAG TPA: hypothetical protein VHX60_12575 [Acidobacteriaceae bacterium]|nr:hypothetical protein [Acidobacteriaceae bacterium]